MLTFAGNSFVVDPFGQLLARAPQNDETILYADLDLARCQHAPARQLFLQHRRPDQYHAGAVRRGDVVMER